MQVVASKINLFAKINKTWLIKNILNKVFDCLKNKTRKIKAKGKTETTNSSIKQKKYYYDFQALFYIYILKLNKKTMQQTEKKYSGHIKSNLSNEN